MHGCPVTLHDLAPANLPPVLHVLPDVMFAVHLQAQLQYLLGVLLSSLNHQWQEPPLHHQENTRSFTPGAPLEAAWHPLAAPPAQQGRGGAGNSSNGGSDDDEVRRGVMARLLAVAEEIGVIVQEMWWWLTQWAGIPRAEASRMMHRVSCLEGQWLVGAVLRDATCRAVVPASTDPISAICTTEIRVNTALVHYFILVISMRLLVFQQLQQVSDVLGRAV